MLHVKLILGAMLFATTTATQSCGYTPPPATPETTAADNLISPAQIHQAKQAAVAYDSVASQITENAEIDVIQRYLVETMKPGFTSYVQLIAMGQPIAYYVAKGPVVDCNRELTPNTHPAAAAVKVAGGYYSNSYEHNIYVADSPNDEGTYGGNSKCVVFFSESGAMIRWTGDYLQSDRPFRIHSASLIEEVKGK